MLGIASSDVRAGRVWKGGERDSEYCVSIHVCQMCMGAESPVFVLDCAEGDVTRRAEPRTTNDNSATEWNPGTVSEQRSRHRVRPCRSS